MFKSGIVAFVFLDILFINVRSDLDSYGSCDVLSKSCQDDTTITNYEKFIFYDVNPPEGFNLRRDVYMRFALMVSEARKHGKKLNWNLVLPPWYNLYHWKTQSKTQVPLPWSHFFDIATLQGFAPVIEMAEVIGKSIKKPFNIDTLYVLQSYENPFENGSFDDKWEITEECNYNGQFWGFTNITVNEIVCVKFQGKISMLWEIISMHPMDSKVMFDHGEIPLHDTYGTKPYWDCRKSMKFGHKLINIATQFVSENLNCKVTKCETYISVHWRRQDFARYRTNDVPSIEGTVKQIHEMVTDRQLQVKKVFIASDATAKEMSELEMQINNNGYKVYFYKPTKIEIDDLKDGGIAIVEQIICSRALFFIGTYESTFSYRIQEEREILGLDSSTTFNRLCPDKGPCERPSKWTIVH